VALREWVGSFFIRGLLDGVWAVENEVCRRWYVLDFGLLKRFSLLHSAPIPEENADGHREER